MSSRHYLRATALASCLACAQAPAPAPLPASGTAAPARSTSAPRSADSVAACKARCQRNVLTRHDACGRAARSPRPDWCAGDNQRMREACELDCERRFEAPDGV